MRLFFFTAGLLAAMASITAAQTPAVVDATPSVNGITITHVGSYTGQSTSVPAAAGQDSPSGTVGTAVNWHFVSDSTDIAGKVGTQFGIEFRIDGAPAGDTVPLYLALTFPEQGISNPNTGERLHNAKIVFPNMKIGALCLLGYGFDNAWEIVPGVWIEQIWFRDRMLAERSFTIVKPE
jgi:hypothetical protein